MAKLSAFGRDPIAMREGEWINPGFEYGGLELKVKAMGADYADLRGSLTRRAARLAGGEEKIGRQEQNRIDVECLNKTALLDVRGLEHDDGKPVTIAEFKEMLFLPEYAELALLAFRCADNVGKQNTSLIESAEGNSSTVSPTISNGQTIKTS